VTTAGSVSLSATTVTITLPMRMVDYTTTYLDSLSRESMIDTEITPTVRIVYLSDSYWATSVTTTLGSSHSSDTITATFTTTATIPTSKKIVVHLTGIKNPPSTK